MICLMASWSCLCMPDKAICTGRGGMSLYSTIWMKLIEQLGDLSILATAKRLLLAEFRLSIRTLKPSRCKILGDIAQVDIPQIKEMSHFMAIKVLDMIK